MKIQLNARLSKDLRSAVNDSQNFSLRKTAEFHCPSDKKGDKSEKRAYNCICAAMDRIDDLIEYLNNLDIEPTKDGVFNLCNFLNYGQTLIDCITIVGQVYGVKYESKNDLSTFHQKGLNGKGNDEKYFKYLRALCSVHPLGTTAYSEFQGKEPEWCPYINFAGTAAFGLLSLQIADSKNVDFIAVVYRNDSEISKYVPIKIKELFLYVKKRYLFIKTIIKGIEDYNKCRIAELKQKHILTPEECKTYREYLSNLENEVFIRYGEGEYNVREWIAVFDTHFADKDIEEWLNQYKEEMKIGIMKVHKKLQDMEIDDRYADYEVLSYNCSDKLKGYHYQREKMSYLYPSGQLENMDEVDYSFINEKPELNIEKLSVVLNELDLLIKNNEPFEELSSFCRFIDGKYRTTSSEWARMQLKIMEPVLGKYIEFDYFLNDWQLYLEYQLSEWLLSKSEEIH